MMTFHSLLMPPYHDGVPFSIFQLSEVVMLGRTSGLASLLRPIRLLLSNYRPQGTSFSPSRYNSYFQPKLPVLEQECGQIIRELGKERPDAKRVRSLLDNYLDFAKPVGSNTLSGTLSLLTAISMSSNNPSNPSAAQLSKYRSLLLEQTNRVTVEGQAVDEGELSCFITAQHEQRKIAKEKVKSTRLLFNLLVVLERNFEAVRPQLYFSVMLTLTNGQYAHHRMVTVARLLQKHAIALLRRVVQKDATLPPETEKIFTEQFLCLLSETFKTYGVESTGDFEVFFGYVQQRLLGKFFSGAIESRFTYCNSLYRSFNYEAKNGEGVYYKQLLFERMCETLLGTTKNVAAIARSKHGYYLCSSILTHHFYMHATSLPLLTHGSLRILPKTALATPPQLPEIFWSVYGMNPQAINYVTYLAHTIRDVYPSRFIPSKGETITTIEPYLQTEMKMRAEAVLVDLGLSFQSQINISGRFIDFLIGERVVLQLDGIHHFELCSLEMTDKTQARNLHLLYKGYQLILINIYEYNVAREHEDLKQLIAAKLKLLQDTDAALVM